MNLNKKVIFLDTVFAQKVDDEMVLLDMNSENYFGLDEVAATIWQAMQENESLEDVLEVLLEQYEVEKDVLEKDLFAFVEKLKKSGLVEVKEN
jgi:ornithine carbamoyltransferase